MKKKQSKFFKKPKQKNTGKKLCILLMIVLTLVMAADLANLFLTPAQSQRGFGPGGFNPGDGSSFTMPEDAEMPGGDFQMPQEGDFQMPEGGFGHEEAPEGMGERPSFAGRPDGGRGSQGSFLQSVRSAWLPILIVCILGDAICLIFLIQMRRREKALEEAFVGCSGMPALEEEEDFDEPPRRRKGPWGAILCMVVAFAMILAMIPTEDTDASSANVRSQVISGTAEAAEIHTVLSGAGTLEADNLTPVTVPQQVTVLKYHVRNGETVAAGDPLVSVDKTSASSAMLDLNEVLADLDTDLETARQNSNANYINATAAGRVKKIYAKTGDKVTDVLYEHGALMLLSLDGTMKITFESSEGLTVGDTVAVQHSGGRDAGRVLSVREGKITVTLSDEKAPYGSQASILDENGETIGKGTLEINSALKVIGYYGKVNTIAVSVGSKVSVGSNLLTLKDTGDTTDYQILLARRNELEAQMQKLSQLARTGMVVAENDGVVSGVPDDAEIALLSASGSVKADNLSASNGSWQVVLLSKTINREERKWWEAYINDDDSDGGDANDGTTGGENTGGGNIGGGNTDGGNTGGENTGGGNTGSGNTNGGNTGNGNTGSGNTDDNTDNEEQTILSGNYAAEFVSASQDTIYLWVNPTAVTDTSIDLSTLASQMTQFGEYTYTGISNKDIPFTDNSGTGTEGSESGTDSSGAAARSSTPGTQNGESNTVKLTGLKKGDLLLLTFTNNVVTDIVKAVRPAAAGATAGEGEQTQEGNATGGMTSGGAGMGGMGSGSGMAAQKSYDQYIAEQLELLYVSDQEETSVTVSVDELDVNSAAIGLEAQVTLDAMKGQSFTGRIARISHEGTNDGGNTKFAVTVILPREATMLDGMNASVKIVTATSNAAVSIPAAALVEKDGKTYVYTTYDQETDTLGGLTQVETGASDGERVEIRSGLEVGNAFHYRYADTVTYSFLTAL